jgi:histidyl-tRNA synthetase
VPASFRAPNALKTLTRPSYVPTADHDFELDMASEAKDVALRGKKKQTPSVQAKTPKGTSDWVGADSDLREEIVTTVSTILRRHGGTTLDTPMFELTEILQNKLGEDQKLIYELADQYITPAASALTYSIS